MYAMMSAPSATVGTRKEPIGSNAVATRRGQIDSLTSLRFIAAACVITHHVAVVFLGVSPSNLSFAQAVSFFFILSGFILTYVHPQLETKSETLYFWRARFARIYPAHVVGLFLACCLVPQCSNILPHMREFLANLFLVQSWIPTWNYFFSFNASSWSVSTEMFFYVVFPVLVYKLESTWKWKLAGSFGLVVALIAICGIFHIPTIGMRVSALSLIYAFPLGRLFEFVLGMCCAVAWTKLSTKEIDPALCNKLEYLTFAATAVFMWFSSPISKWMSTQPGLDAVSVWFLYSGNCLFMAAMIVVFSLQRGSLSRFLTHKPLVWLGELSYSIYILHFPIMIWVLSNMKAFGMTPQVAAGSFLVGLLAICHVFSLYVERPLRSFILGKKRKRPLLPALSLEPAVVPVPVHSNNR